MFCLVILPSKLRIKESLVRKHLFLAGITANHVIGYKWLKVCSLINKKDSLLSNHCVIRVTVIVAFSCKGTLWYFVPY